MVKGGDKGPIKTTLYSLNNDHIGLYSPYEYESSSGYEQKAYHCREGPNANKLSKSKPKNILLKTTFDIVLNYLEVLTLTSERTFIIETIHRLTLFVCLFVTLFLDASASQ